MIEKYLMAHPQVTEYCILGQRGARLTSMAFKRRALEELRAFRPAVIVVILGDNDTHNSTAPWLFDAITLFGQQLRAETTARAVYVSQLYPRLTRGLYDHQSPHNVVGDEVNMMLSSLKPEDGVLSVPCSRRKIPRLETRGRRRGARRLSWHPSQSEYRDDVHFRQGTVAYREALEDPVHSSLCHFLAE